MTSFQESGDAAAFEALFHRHKGGLYRFLLRLSGNPAVAEEVSQQTWLKMIELAEQGRYEPVAQFRTLLYALARNRWMDDHVRRHEPSRTMPLDEARAEVLEMPSGDPDAADLLVLREGEAALAQALTALPPEQLEVVALWMQGFRLVDVARITGAGWHTVVSRKRYALARLRQQLLPLRQGG